MTDEPEKLVPRNVAASPWEGKLDPDEAIEILRKRAWTEESRQARLVELGDRSEPYAPAMREAYVCRWLANWLEKRKLDRENDQRRFGR
jgi:DNA repair photolyase